MDKSDVRDMFINPFNAINIRPNLSAKHQPNISEAQWVQVNLKLIDEIGAQQWLERLLAVLQGDYPRVPDARETE